MVINYTDCVWPSEIEAVLFELSDIKAACVVGIPFDLIRGVPAAVVVVREHGSQITEDDICKMVAGILVI